MKNEVKSVATQLLQKVEKMVKIGPQAGRSYPSEEKILKVLQEFGEYSVELEIQNEELLTARAFPGEIPEKVGLSESVKQEVIPGNKSLPGGPEILNQELLLTIIEHAPDIIIQLDQSGNILYMNRAFPGYTVENNIGKNVCEWTLPECQALMQQSLELVYHELTTQTFQSGVLDAAGETRWYLTSISPVKEGPVAKTAIMIAHDVTETIKNEELLRENEEKKKAIIATTRDGFWISDQQGHLLEVNDTYCRMTGYTKEELLTMCIRDIEAFENADETALHIQKIMESGEERFESGHRRKDGSIMAVESSVQYTPINGGQFISFLHDITKQKHVEQSLIQSDERYKSLFQNNHSVILLINPATGDIIDANSAACSYYGWSHAELCHKSLFEIDLQPREETLFKLQQSTHEENNHLFLQHQLANGELRDIEVYSGPIQIDESTMLYTIIHDITESKKAQDALRISEERYSLIYSSSRDGVFSMDISGLLTGANRSFCEEINLELSDIIGHTFAEIGLPEYMCLELQALKQQIHDTNSSIISEPKIQFNDGSIRYYEVVLNPLHDNDNSIVGIGGSIRNITKRKETEYALIESEKRFRYLVKNMPVGIILYGPDSKVITVNPKALELLGVREEQLMNNPNEDEIYNAIHEDGSAFLRDEHPVPVTFATGQSVRDVVMGIYRSIKSDFIWVLIDTEVILKEDGSIRNVVCSFIDITILKKN